MHNLVCCFVGDFKFFVFRKSVADGHDMVIEDARKAHCEQLLPAPHIAELVRRIFKNVYNAVVIALNKR